MKELGPRPLYALLTLFLVSTLFFLASVGAAYYLASYTSPGWNEASVPPPVTY